MKRTILIIPMVLVVVALSACGGGRGSDDPAPAQSPGAALWGTVTGTVHDADGRPVSGALVVPRAVDPSGSPAPEKAVTTDPAGHYEWRLLPGRYELVAHADGRVSPAVAVSVDADRQTAADLTLNR
jgi:hypothetical protein